MRHDRHVARDISYAHSAATRGGRVLIRTMENLSGRIGLIKRADGYEDEVASGRDFWEVMAERYGLSLDVRRGSLDAIPRDGPMILIANHPYGILDGLMMGLILRQTRGEFRILANSVFRKADELNRYVLPVSFDETRDAVQTNLNTRKEALGILREGGAIGVFPGGAVATSARPFSRPMDPGWGSFTARLIAKSEATVVPMFFEGENSRLFQLASHMHQTLRLGLLIKEFGRRVDAPVKIMIGEPMGHNVLTPLKSDAKSLMEFLRRKTYELSERPVDPSAVGYEWN